MLDLLIHHFLMGMYQLQRDQDIVVRKVIDYTYNHLHLNLQHLSKDNEFVLTHEMDKTKSSEQHKEESSLNIIESSKKKGILPEKIKKFLYEETKYYINKNDVLTVSIT